MRVFELYTTRRDRHRANAATRWKPWPDGLSVVASNLSGHSTHSAPDGINVGADDNFTKQTGDKTV